VGERLPSGALVVVSPGTNSIGWAAQVRKWAEFQFCGPEQVFLFCFYLFISFLSIFKSQFEFEFFCGIFLLKLTVRFNHNIMKINYIFISIFISSFPLQI
jgi:hypothetical protein